MEADVVGVGFKNRGFIYDPIRVEIEFKQCELVGR